MAKPSENEPALPWAPRPLGPLGAELEVEIEGDWISVEVAEAHGDHQYTLLAHPVDEDDAPPAQPQGGAAAGAAAAAAGGAQAGGPHTAGQAAAAEEDNAEGDEVLEMRVKIVSDTLLDILDSDGESAGGSIRCQWRPAPTSMQEMFSRAFLNLAQRQPLPRGVELPSADQLAAVMAQGLKQLVQRAVDHSKEAGSEIVEVESVHAAMAGMAAELGLPVPEEVRAQQARQAQQAQAQQQQQQGGEGAEDGRPEKKARKSP